jgi:hypothetical protein
VEHAKNAIRAGMTCQEAVQVLKKYADEGRYTDPKTACDGAGALGPSFSGPLTATYTFTIGLSPEGRVTDIGEVRMW